MFENDHFQNFVYFWCFFFSAETTCTARWHVCYNKKQAHFSQLFCLQVRSVTPWQSHERKSRCLRGRRHSSILYSPSGFFSSYFTNEVNFYHYKKYGSVARFTIFVLTSLKSKLEHFWQMSRWNPIYVPEIETGRHVKNNACTVEIKIKWMIRKHITYENTYLDNMFSRYSVNLCLWI